MIDAQNYEQRSLHCIHNVRARSKRDTAFRSTNKKHNYYPLRNKSKVNGEKLRSIAVVVHIREYCESSISTEIGLNFLPCPPTIIKI